MEVEEISSDPTALKKRSLIGQDSVAQDIVKGLLDIIDPSREGTNGNFSSSVEDVPSTDSATAEDPEASNGDPQAKCTGKSNGSPSATKASIDDCVKTNGTSTSGKSTFESPAAASSSSDSLVNGSASTISISSDSSLDDTTTSKTQDKDVIEVEPMNSSSSNEKLTLEASSSDKGCSADDGLSGADCENVNLESGPSIVAANTATSVVGQDESSSDSVFKNGAGADDNDVNCLMEEPSAADKASSATSLSSSSPSSPPHPSNGTSSRLASDLSATISQLAARVSRSDDSATASGLDGEKSVEDQIADVSMEDDEDEEEQEDNIVDVRESSSKEASIENSATISREVNGDDNRTSSPPSGSSFPSNNDAPTPVTLTSSLTRTSPNLTKGQINAIIEQRFQAYVKNLCKTDELETRFSSLEEWTENLRKKHREQDKTLMKIERTARVGERKGGCRHVACQTNLGGGSLQAAQKAVRSGTNAGVRPGMPPPQANNAARPNNHPPNNANKRSQEVVDLTDEDSSPAMKRSNSGQGIGTNPGYNHSMPNQYGGVPSTAGPGSAALQQLVASGAAKVVTPATGRNVPNSLPHHNRGVGGINTTAHNGHPQNYPPTSSNFNNRPLQQQQQRNLPNPPRRDGRHPAPLPAAPMVMALGAKLPPPKPFLKIEVAKVPENRGVMLSWDILGAELASCARIQKYQLYAYQETTAPPHTNLWKKIGDDVAAMALPMACTLSHFLAGHFYHFAVRAMDEHSRIGPFSDPQTIYLQ